MDLSNYAGLQATVADYLNRADMTARIPVFIQLAEAQIKRRLRRKSVITTITIAQEQTTLPADCAELRSIHLLTNQRWLDKAIDVGTIEQLSDVRANHMVAGRPVRAAMLGKQLIVAPEPDQSYNAAIVYFQQLTPLSSSVSTNDVLAENPDLYLFGALMESAPFLEHDERISTWKQKFDDALTQLDLVRAGEETNASYRPMRLPRRLG